MAVSQRGWALTGAGVGVALVAITYLAGVGPQLSHTSSVRSQTDAAKQANQTLTSQINSLRAQSKNLDELTTKLSADQVAVPSEDGMAGFIREVNTLAVADGLAVKSVGVSAPTGVGANASTPVSAAGNLFQIPLTIAVNGAISHEIDLVAKLHAMGSRAVLIGNVQVTSSTETPSDVADMTIDLKVFVAPQTAADEAALKKELAAA